RRDAFALVPAAPDSVMAALFQKCHITPVVYPLDNDHEFAWRLLSQPIAAGDQASAEVYESQVLRSYLAATYARAKGRRLRADRVISREELRFGISVPAQLAPRVRDAIVATLVLDELNTAYSLIKGLPPDRARLAAVIETSVKQVGLQPPNGPPNLAAVIEDL